MDEHAVALEITRLKMRMEIHEALLLQLRLFVPHSIAESTFRENQAGALSALEEIASALERQLMISDQYGRLTAEERALYADELRELVVHMKDYVTSMSPK